MQPRHIFPLATLAFAAASIVFSFPFSGKHALAATAPAVTYDKDGSLLLPPNYREWVYLSSGMDMSYTSESPPEHSVFDNVFVSPEAYRAFMKTGTWPDKTAFVLEAREAKDRGSINLRGHYQSTAVMGLEVHVKDASRFAGKWGFYAVDSTTLKGKLFQPDANCYSCHSEHGAVDTTFVQFYPTLLPIADQKKTLSPAYLSESGAAVKP